MDSMLDDSIEFVKHLRKIRGNGKTDTTTTTSASSTTASNCKETKFSGTSGCNRTEVVGSDGGLGDICDNLRKRVCTAEVERVEGEGTECVGRKEEDTSYAKDQDTREEEEGGKDTGDIVRDTIHHEEKKVLPEEEEKEDLHSDEYIDNFVMVDGDLPHGFLNFSLMNSESYRASGRVASIIADKLRSTSTTDTRTRSNQSVITTQQGDWTILD